MASAFEPVLVDPELIAPDRVRPLRRAEYDHLVAAGLFEDERLELLAGRLVTMSPQGSPHAELVTRLAATLLPPLLDRAEVRVRLPFAASDDSEPEPDLAVVPRGDYLAGHPERALLVVEVAASSLPKDLALKAAIYEAAAVDEYWVVDLTGPRVVVFRRGPGGGFAAPTAHGPGEALAPLAFPDLQVALADLLAGVAGAPRAE